MTDDAWGDLFAKAAEVGSSPSSSDPVKNIDGNNEKEGKNRKRKRNQKSTDSSNSHFHEAMLQGRMRSCQENSTWPHWMHLGEPILQLQHGRKCHGWTPKQTISSPQQTSAVCASCGTSALNHRLNTDRGGSHWPFVAFCELRNLRCTASFLAQQYEITRTPSHISFSLEDNNSVVSIESIIQSVSTGSNVLASLKPSVWRQLPHDEAQVLESKLNDVLRYCTLVLNSIPQKKRRNRDPSTTFLDHWEPSVRLMIACDAVYYRMYYLQLVQLLPTGQINGKICFLPHPSHYFGLPFLTLDMNSVEEHLDNYDSFKTPTNENVSASAQGDELNGTTTVIPSSCEHTKEHPLAVIHRYRQMETHRIFYKSGWMAFPRTAELTLASLEKFLTEESKHETPAPDVLMEWRDACRDFLCNVYAYATVSSEGMSRLGSFLKANAMEGGVIEIGAGTGYIAKLLEGQGVSVDPWDIHPTSSSESTRQLSSMNEYHGNTPPFLVVKQGSKIPNMDCGKKALLLCYPPPGSSMAHDALDLYIKRGGTCLIHIGEFKGLTGDTRFESLLVRQMTCSFRHPCLTWGTDASHVTVWIKDHSLKDTKNINESAKILLPCCHCALREGTKRCRLLRSLVYCSKECFEKDSKIREKKLQMQWIRLKHDALNIYDPKHFAPL